MQTPPQDTGFTKRPHSAPTAFPQREHGALEDPTALPHRAVQSSSPGIDFVHVENKHHRMALMDSSTIF